MLTGHPRTSRRPAGLALLVIIAMAGCYQEPSRWDQANQETRGKKAVDAEAVKGGEFNRFFPKDEGEYDVVYTQEKPGFAEAKLVQGGKDVASLAIFDGKSNAEALDKFKDSPEKLGSYPKASQGSRGTQLLVGDRYLVTVRSLDANFTEDQRDEWLQKFDLANLAGLP